MKPRLLIPPATIRTLRHIQRHTQQRPLELIRQILITIVLDTLLALPVYALARRLLLPHIPDDPRRRRRRAYTTGGLSPLSRA